MLTEIHVNHKNTHTHYEHYNVEDIKIFGFWIYLMSDCVLFATLFATYAVLSNNTVGGPTSKDIFELPFVLVATLLLLLSTITHSMVISAMRRDDKSLVTIWLCLTFLLGFYFICIEFYEFYHFITKGYGPDHSAFLSSFFALVGIHGVHIISGLLWILVMIAQVLSRGLTSVNNIRLQCLSLFWHFLDIVWICVFTVVYLLGVL